MSNTDAKPGADWLQIVMQNGTPAFDAAFEPGAMLQASVLRKPLIGPRLISAFFSGTSKMYDQITFTADVAAGAKTYLEWEGSAFGVSVAGTTILSRNSRGLITTVRLFHSPFDVIQPFSQELARRLKGTLGPEYFV